MMGKNIIVSCIIILFSVNYNCDALNFRLRKRILEYDNFDPVTNHLLPANKTRGESCTVDGRKGTCENWRNCFSILVDNIQKNFPPVCSYEGKEPIVCCTSCLLVDDVSNAELIQGNGKIVWRTKQKSWNQCINYAMDLPYQCKFRQNWSLKKDWNETRQCFNVAAQLIGQKDTFGGRNAYRGEFPHMALLGYGPAEAAQWLCGGSVISDRYILTAAHCIASGTLGPVTYAALGILKRSDPEDLWEKYSITERTPHPKYQAPSKYHDIALLKTEKTIKYTYSVRPACLPDLSHTQSSPIAFAAGWGALGHRGELADTLQAVDIMEYPSDSCASDYKKHRHLAAGYDNTTQICYGDYDKPGDTCEGDSGGPLMIRGEVLDCLHIVIGVTSFGHACGVIGQAGVYTHVKYYVPWLESVVWPGA